MGFYRQITGNYSIKMTVPAMTTNQWNQDIAAIVAKTHKHNIILGALLNGKWLYS